MIPVFCEYKKITVCSSCYMQLFLQNVSRPQSSQSGDIGSECSDIDSLLTKSTNSTPRLTPSSLACSSTQSLNSLNLKQPKIYEPLSNIQAYEGKHIFFLIKNIKIFIIALIVLEGGSKTQAITDALIYMIARDNMPLSITEKPGFIYFMRKTAPLYKIPSRKVITNLVKSKYQVLSSLVKSRLSNVEYMTITADIWTNIINTTSFLGMTVHFLSMSKDSLDSVTIGVLELADSHNANNICEWFEQILKEWGIRKQQVLTVVTDSGANILSAVKKHLVMIIICHVLHIH